MAHVRERSPGVWEIIVSAGRDPRTGRPKQVSRTVRAVKRAGTKGAPRAVSDMVHELEARAADAKPSARITVSELLDIYTDHAEAIGRSPKTIVGYRAIARAVACEASTIGKVRIGTFSAADANRYIAWLRSTLGPFDTREEAAVFGREPRRESSGWVCPPLEARTVHNHRMLLTQAFNHAIHSEWRLPPNPLTKTSAPTLPTPRPRTIPPERVQALVAGCLDVNPDFAALILLSGLTGCRRGEVCSWHFSWVDYSAATLTVQGAISDTTGAVAEKGTKTGRDRLVGLDELALALFAAQWSRYVEKCRRLGVEPTDRAFVFSQEDDHSKPWRPDRVTHTFQRLRSKLGMPEVRLKDFRSFATSTQLAGGIDPATVAARAGHDPAVMLRYYAAVAKPRDQAAAELLGRVLGPAAAVLLPGTATAP